MLRICILAIASTAFSSDLDAQIGAFETNCKFGGRNSSESYQFIATCAGRASSPNRMFAVVQRTYSEQQPPIEFQDRHGRVLAKLQSLSDDMPFTVSCAPDSQWFFVNYHVGSFMDRLQLFEIVGKTVVERKKLSEAAVRIATRRYPCLPPEMVLPNGVKWSSDSRRIAIVTVSAPYACKEFGRVPGTFKSLWMIGDVKTERVLPGTTIAQADDKPFALPARKPFQEFRSDRQSKRTLKSTD